MWKGLKETDFSRDFLKSHAGLRKRYLKLPLSERVVTDFGYYMRMEYIKYLKERHEDS